jgi:hypothetical protein
MKNVLLVDNNLGFVYWAAQALGGIECQAWPASSTGDATSILFIRHVAPLDLLIINPAIRGAPLLVTRLRRSQPHLKVVALGQAGNKTIRGVDLWQPRPDPGGEEAWVREIERLVAGRKRAA